MNNPKQKKLLNDLEVVRDNLKLFNQLVNNKERVLAGEIINRIEKMENRLLKLPDILNN